VSLNALVGAHRRAVSHPLDPPIKDIGDDRGDVESDHPFRPEQVGLLDVIVRLKFEFDGHLSEHDGLAYDKIQRNGPQCRLSNPPKISEGWYREDWVFLPDRRPVDCRRHRVR